MPKRSSLESVISSLKSRSVYAAVVRRWNKRTVNNRLVANHHWYVTQPALYSTKAYVFMAAKKAIFVCAAKRTAFGKFGGSMLGHSATDMSVHASEAAVRDAGLDPKDIDQVVIGNVIPSSPDGAYLGRHVALRIGAPETVPGLTVNRLCASGFEAVATAARMIQLGEADVVVAGGTENMSQAPFVVRNIRFGTQLAKDYKFEDLLWEGLSDGYIKMPMGITAEILGAKYKITRADCDKYAERSQRLYQLGQSAGVFKEEIAPIEVKTRKGKVPFEVDEHPRETSLAKLAAMPPTFKKDGLTCAGSASGVCDGAASLVIASEEACKKHKLTPLARLVGYSTVGCDPKIMGIGPVPAIQQLFKQTGLSFKDMELVEINEAFAAQTLACQKALMDDGLDPEKLNQNGGAIAVGHPLGASGARISAHIVHELKRRKAKYGVGSACVGGGMGMAMIFENLVLS